jgi:hypothetical protein
MRVRSRLLASRVLPFAIFVAFVALRVAYWHPAGEMRDDDYVSATAVLFHGRIDPSWGPLYSLWLWAFRNLVGLVALPLASWALIVLANLVIGWRIARLAGASPIAATVAPLPCAALGAADVLPHALFLCAVVGGGGILAMRARTRCARFAALAAGFVAGAFVRPEVLFAAALAFCAAAITAFREPQQARALLAPLGLALVLFGWFGNPLSGGRSAFAFGQHYKFNVTLERGDPSFEGAWEPVVTRDFGATVTPAQAACANPTRFAWHIQRNVRQVTFLAALLAPPESVDRRIRAAVAIPFALVLAYGLWLARSAERARPVFWAAAFLAAPTVAASLLIFPRLHYSVAMLQFLVAAAAAGIGPEVRASGEVSTPACEV